MVSVLGGENSNKREILVLKGRYKVVAFKK